MAAELRFRVGDVVEVLSKEEILRSLDSNGQLDGLPFMPEMLEFCGRRFRVVKRAHKTCDTVNGYRNRRMRNAVHLEGLRCDGGAHGGCEAGCLIYWKEAWLRKVGAPGTYSRTPPVAAFRRIDGTQNSARLCRESDVMAGTQRPGAPDASGPLYVCQATQAPAATERIAWWDLRQYIEDYASGNVSLAGMACGFMYQGYDSVMKLGIGVGAPMRWLYDVFQRLRGGVPYPGRAGCIPVGRPTPTGPAELKAGDLVRVKEYDAILATCDQTGRNRGMTFDAEMVPYCGGTYRVLKRVARIVDERTGRMQAISNPCIILDGVVCQGRYSSRRLFCPRSIYPYWREIWLERVPEHSDQSGGSAGGVGRSVEGGSAMPLARHHT